MRTDPVGSPPIYLCGPGDSMSSLKSQLVEDGQKVLGLGQLHTVGPQHWEAKAIVIAGPSDALIEYVSHWRNAGCMAPIIVQSSGVQAMDQALLDSGADELIVPPLRSTDLKQRIALARARRAHRVIFQLGPRTVDLEDRTVTHGSEQHRLTQTEIRLLEYLVQHPNRVVTQLELLRNVWGYTHPPRTRAVANTLMRLRPKLEADPSRPIHLLTVHGGVRWVPEPVMMAHSNQEEVADDVGYPIGPLIGREAVLHDLENHLRERRAVCLHGPPGVGKTRLAQEVVNRFGTPTRFIDLALSGPMTLHRLYRA